LGHESVTIPAIVRANRPLYRSGLHQSERRVQKFREYAAVALTTLISLSIFFRTQISNGFSVQFGDKYDGMIELNLLQHWRNVFHGHERWDVVNYFYPFRGTLGYNDGYFLYGLLFTLFRDAGANSFLAAELVNIAVRATGVVAMYALLRGPVGCRLGWSLLGAATFSVANNSFVQAGHAQLLLVSLTPLASLLLWRFLQALMSGSRSGVILWGSALAVLLSAWFMTGFYTAWFFAYFVAIFGIVALAAVGRDGRRRFFASVRGHVAPLAMVLAVQAITLIPFVSVYLPKLKETGGYGWQTPRFYSPNPIDVINVSPDNIVWGTLYTGVRNSLMPSLIDTELQSGITPLLFILGMLAILFAVRQPRGDARIAVIRWIAIATLLSWLLTIRFGEVSLWRYVKPLLPGSRGIRVVARYQLVVMVPVTILAFWWLDRWRGAKAGTIAALMGVFVVIEQINVTPSVLLRGDEQRKMLADVPPVPGACRSFYVVYARRAPYDIRQPFDRLYPHNVDAMTIAEERGIPTLNGISTFTPQDWPSSNPSEPGYIAGMRTYARSHQLHGVCALDMTRGGWSLDIA
jgi:hypothetical protein